MSARIVELSRVAAAASIDWNREQAQLGSEELFFWTGASSHRYVHSVFSLIGCPELPPANYILVRRDTRGRRRILRIGRTDHDAPSLNLAEIRHRGAKLGANEVHVHLLTGNEGQRRLVEMDLRAAHFPVVCDEEESPAHVHH
jgi:hypothetical protein